MRISKSETEIELMKKAGRVIDDAVSKAFAEAQIGMTELDVQLIVQQEIRNQGATPTFAIVQFGENSALPHSSPGARALVWHAELQTDSQGESLTMQGMVIALLIVSVMELVWKFMNLHTWSVEAP